MASIWNSDGSTQAHTGTGRGSGGGQQTHSIFGWADEKAEKAVTENRAQSERTWGSKPDTKAAAGVMTKKEGEIDTSRKVAESKIKDIQGHNIFNATTEDAPTKGSYHTDARRIKEIQGNDIFKIAGDDLGKKSVSSNKAKELKGNTGIFGDDGASPYTKRTQSLKCSQPAGGRSTITFG
eukprot:CAMPEP_0117653870 /NCGR_PEP_ID=MMETSP0804-20121206/3431_1 /TAXON_ID=1074897 /ORGANISM="Tetraselmis astigmatica, Strain CCMP880" /LENGTH=179 /DNA_ID=CAMNT_0005460093 /DNA_START=664 /DNA_END=1203 /DNA_ORIENTATION=+